MIRTYLRTSRSVVHAAAALCLSVGVGLLAGPGAAQVVSTANGDGAVLRMLDKVSGQVRDIALAAGDVTDLGRITVALQECRYPVGNPSGDAFAYLSVLGDDRDVPVFVGWMVASSPALNAMDHARYDVWVLRCTTS